MMMVEWWIVDLRTRLGSQRGERHLWVNCERRRPRLRVRWCYNGRTCLFNDTVSENMCAGWVCGCIHSRAHSLIIATFIALFIINSIRKHLTLPYWHHKMIMDMIMIRVFIFSSLSLSLCVFCYCSIRLGR